MTWTITLSFMINCLAWIATPIHPQGTFEQMTAQRIEVLQEEDRELLYYQLDYLDQGFSSLPVEAEWAERPVEVWVWAEVATRFSWTGKEVKIGRSFQKILRNGRDLAALRIAAESGGGKCLLLIAAAVKRPGSTTYETI